MKLIEALEVVRRQRPSDARRFAVPLLCGFTPLHLQTFLAANLALAYPDQKIEIPIGLYGDLIGNIERVHAESIDGCCVVLEWADLDARLGYRSSGSWSPSEIPDMVRNVSAMLRHVAEAVPRISESVPVAASLPTLRIPPIPFTPGWMASGLELELQEALSIFASGLARHEKIRLVSASLLDMQSPHRERHDLKSEVLSGFPYTITHASTLAALLVDQLKPSRPKKGVISDLDDTLWEGILGESDVAGISWDLEHGSHLHGVYQRLLASLAAAGVFIGIASKNDPQIVSRAFERPDLLIPKEVLFPVEANWGPKSASVRRILKAWNIGASDVIFIDDNPMEIAEVQRAYPEMVCLPFPKDNPKTIEELLRRLRDLFGKTALSDDDRLRLKSVRTNAEVQSELGSGASLDEFLQQANGQVTIHSSRTKDDPRAFELVNKTNQFNLNGRRFTENAWRKFLSESDALFQVISYEDKFGPLGKISVMGGSHVGRCLELRFWVMSCRAFSRRIEYHVLDNLFQKYGIEQISFDFEATAKNGPVQDFLTAVLGTSPTSSCKLSKVDFVSRKPQLFHRVIEKADE